MNSKDSQMNTAARLGVVFVIAIAINAMAVSDTFAQRRAPSGPGVVTGITWSDDGKSVSFINQGQQYCLDLNSLEREKLGPAPSVRDGGI